MPQISYAIDPIHSSVHFSVRHLMLSNVRGEFTRVSGSIRLDPENPANSQAEATIDASSIETREAQRNTHLKSAEFLDVAKYPSIQFRSRRIEPKKDGGKVIGDLTIHGITREVTLEVEGSSAEIKDPMGNQRIGFSATGKFNRKDFGVTWNSPMDTGGMMVGDEVKVTLEIEAVRS